MSAYWFLSLLKNSLKFFVKDFPEILVYFCVLGFFSWQFLLSVLTFSLLSSVSMYLEVFFLHPSSTTYLILFHSSSGSLISEIQDFNIPDVFFENSGHIVKIVLWKLVGFLLPLQLGLEFAHTVSNS